jgi:hypothetical protein
VQINGNKIATGQILEKLVESCERADSSWLSSKVSRTLEPATASNNELIAFENNRLKFKTSGTL